VSGLRLYNTLTRSKEDFVPLDAKNVRMYVCGPTVYDYAHIGNARPAIVFDVLFRLLRHLYGENHVTYVRNITDVDDKINARAMEVAAEKSIAIEAAREEITALTAKQYHDDVTALGCLPPTREPRATEYIRQMVQMIEVLIRAGHAYEAGGHVLYDVSSKADYGKLARRSLDEMIAGARVEVAPYKKNPMDFVLWKPSDSSLPGWHSPWGRGRPGWHIECSAMADALLGATFDIHGGGIDLLFPHHENEIAQSEGAHAAHPPARVWMHNGFLQVEGEKMSKSLGNFVTIRELLSARKFGGRSWSGPVLRLSMLMTHYRQPIDWTEARLREAEDKAISWFIGTLGFEPTDEYPKEVVGALCDDLNTPAAIAKLDALREGIFKKGGTGQIFANGVRLLGLNLTKENLELPPIYALATGRPGTRSAERDWINGKLSERTAARAQRDFKEADRIRDELLAKGIQLKDNPDGTTTWEVKR
jgi:cysteinyl-tRNA synthetase